ncbi:unnamed protein product [Effrenium voratum]|nr:unnamed protein product [Effrenium voratum]
MPRPLFWEIVGGADKGGILVREGESIKSAQLDERLATGSLVEQLALKGERLQYKLLSGQGPAEGWVSLSISGKPLAVSAKGPDGTNGTNGTNGTSEEPKHPETPEENERSSRWTTWAPLPAERWATFPRFGDGGRPTSLGAFKKVVGEPAIGEFWGLHIPLLPAELATLGPEWLTAAMHAAGTLPSDNRVVKFTQFDVKAANTTESTSSDEASWGGAGMKILLSVEYERQPVGDEPGTDMFVKMPHEFTGKNERFKVSVTLNGDWAETMFYNLLSGKLPIRTPRIFFSDMNRRTTNFIWIMERVPYGSDWKKELGPQEFLPPAAKYRDWALPCAMEMYYAHSKCLARFFGWYYHTSKRTSQIDECFADPTVTKIKKDLHSRVAPLGQRQREAFFIKCLSDPKMQPLVAASGFPESAGMSFIQLGEHFVRQTAMHCFPPELVEEKTLAKILKEAKDMARYMQEIMFYFQLIPEYNCFAHPNAQVDNAMFWKENGAIQCGLIDWGGASFSTMPAILCGGWMGAEPEFLEQHERKLLDCFAAEYQEVTGVVLDRDLLHQDYQLAQGVSISGCCANVQWCTRLLDKSSWKNVKSRFDQQIDNTFLLRCYFVQLEFILSLLHKRSPYPAFQAFQRRVGLKAKA